MDILFSDIQFGNENIVSYFWYADIIIKTITCHIKT
jgi:hypothetical protein